MKLSLPRRRFRRARATSAPSRPFPIRRYRNFKTLTMKETPLGSHDETDSETGDDDDDRSRDDFEPRRGPGTSTCRKSQARPDRQGARARDGRGPIDDHQVDDQQPWWDGRSLRRRALRYGSQEPEQDCKVSDQAEPGPPDHDISGAPGRPRVTNNLLLSRGLRGEHWQERWGEEPHQQIHYASARNRYGLIRHAVEGVQSVARTSERAVSRPTRGAPLRGAPRASSLDQHYARGPRTTMGRRTALPRRASATSSDPTCPD